MKIKVIRDYSGEEGTDVDKNVLAGSEHVVSRARAAALKAVGLVQIIGDDLHPDDENSDAPEADQEPNVSDPKQTAPESNKQAPKPNDKAAAKANGKNAGTGSAA